MLAWVTSRTTTNGYLAAGQQAAVDNLLRYVRENDLDGANIDDERMQSFNAVAGAPNRTLVGDFFARLQQAFKAADPGYHLSFAAPPVIAARDAYGAAWFDWSRIADCVEAMDGRREKLLAGVSLDFSGHEWPCASDRPLARILGRGRSLDLAACEAQAERYGKRWDEAQASAWYAGREGDHFVQGWYNDVHAWTAKLEWLREQGLGRVGVWVLDGETDPPARWELLLITLVDSRIEASLTSPAAHRSSPARLAALAPERCLAQSAWR